ncbi:MAG: hypothetical protein RL033_6558 [Pseudomonadota bacterium]
MMPGSDSVEASGRPVALLFTPFRLDPAEGRLWRGDELVPLRPRAFEVLRYLLEHAGQLVTHEQLLHQFWGDVRLSDGVLKTQIAEIRLALGDSARAPCFIETVHRRGYRFLVSCERVLAAAPAAAALVPSVGGAGRPTLAEPLRTLEHLIGRSSELGFLSERRQRASAGARQTVLISGEAGIGKTALVQAFLQLEQAAEPGTWISWGQCIEQYGSGEPYLPMIEALRKAGEGPAGQTVAECLRRSAPTWLAMMSGSQSLEAPAASDARAATPGRMLREIVEMLEEVANRCGVILLIEDLHWADPSTLDLIAYLAQRTGQARLMTLGTYRPVEDRAGRLADTLGTLTSRGRGCELQVAPLSLGAIREYLAQRFPSHLLPPAVAELLHQRTEGNALFMVGIVDGWLQRGMLSVAEGRCELATALEELERWVPDTFVRAVERGLERLSPFERSVLEAASVAGNEFSVAAVAAALAEDIVAVEEACMRWARRGELLRSTGVAEWKDGTVAERCQFLHALYQEIAYAQLGAARQAQLHLRIARRLEQAYGCDADNLSPELAAHFEKGRDYPRAVHYLRRAGERALRRSAFHEATKHLRRALELVDRLPDTADSRGVKLELLLLVVLPLRATKGYAASELELVYARAAELCEGRASPAQRCAVLAGQGASHILRAAYGEAAAAGAELLRLAQAASDMSVVAEADLILGIAAHGLGQQASAQVHLCRVVEFHEQCRVTLPSNMTSLDEGFSACGMLAQSLWMLGFPDQAWHLAEKTLERARATGNPFGAAHALSYCSGVLLLRGDLAPAAAHAAQLETLCSERGFEMFAPFASLHTAGVSIERGEPAAAIDGLARALSAYEATGSRAYRSYWYCSLATALAGTGQLQEALHVLEELLQGEPGQREALWDADIHRLRGELTLQVEARAASGVDSVGRNAMAESCFLSALQIAQQQGAKPLELRAALSLARYWRRRGDASPWIALIRECYGWFSEGFDTVDVARARAFLAELAEPDSVHARQVTSLRTVEGRTPK